MPRVAKHSFVCAAVLTLALVVPGAAMADTGLHRVHGSARDVWDSWAGASLAGVTITCSNGATATTGEDGGFDIEVPDGAYTFTPSAPDRYFDPSSGSVTVAGDDATLTPSFRTGGCISGRVRHPDGRGIPGVLVWISNGGLQATTDAKGRFRLVGLAGGFKYNVVAVGYRNCDPSGAEVYLSGRDVKVPYDFIGRAISGRVCQPSGAPIQGAWLMYSRGSFADSVWTDANGYYEIPIGVSGSFDLEMIDGFGALDFRPAVRTVSYSGLDVSGQDFTGIGPYNITAHVVDESGAGVSSVKFDCSYWGAPAMTDATGALTIPDMPNGRYTITPELTRFYRSTPSSATVVVSDADTQTPTFVISPVQAATRMSRVPVASKVSYRRGRRGISVVLKARLLDAYGGVRGATVFLMRSNDGRHWVHKTTLRTDSNATVMYRERLKKSAYFRWVFPATAFYQAASTKPQLIRIK